MIAISTTVLVFVGVAFGFIGGLLIGAALTVIGMNREQRHIRRGMWQLLENGKRCIQEYFNCPTLEKKFLYLNKLSTTDDDDNWYEIRVSKIYPGREGLSRYIAGASTTTNTKMKWYE